MCQYSLLHPVGRCNVGVLNPENGARYRGEFVVVDRPMPSILGARTVQQMALMTIRHENISQLSQTGELGTLPGQLHLEVNSSIKPVQWSARRIPVAVRDKLVQEIERTEHAGVIIA